MKESHRKFLNPLYTNFVKEEIKARSKHWIVPARVSGFICPCCQSGSGPHGTGIMESKKYPNQFCCYSSRTGECWDGYQDIIGIVRHMYKVSFYDALEIAAEKVGYQLPDPELFKDEKNLPKHTVPIFSQSRKTEVFEKPKQEDIDFIQTELKKYQANLDQTDYYKKRGLSKETVAKFGCGYEKEWMHPYYVSLDIEEQQKKLVSILKQEGYEEVWNRICKFTKEPFEYIRKKHPIYVSSHGICLHKPLPSERFIIPTSESSYLARLATPVLTDYQKRYSKMKVGKQSSGLNWDILKQKPKTPVIVTEGEFDAMSVEEVGFTAIALGSTSMINRFCSFLEENKIKPAYPLILSLDNDTSGRSSSLKMFDALRKINVFSVSDPSIILHGCKDPNESLCKDREAFTQFVSNAVESSKALQASFASSRKAQETR